MNSSIPIPILETNRLRLRPFTLSDATYVEKLAGDAGVAEMTLNIPHPYPAGLAVKWISTHQEAAERGESYSWAITQKETGTLMGSISLRITPQHERGEVGYWLGRAYWNYGYMTEALRQILDDGFARFGLHRIQATSLPQNIASWRVMEKAGMQREGLLRAYYRKGDRYVDVLLYSILHADSHT